MDLDKEKIEKTTELLYDFLIMNDIDPKIAFNAFFSLLSTAMCQENIPFETFKKAMIREIDQLKSQWN